jgi:DNA-binding CsgD family transcriptional regulator
MPAATQAAAPGQPSQPDVTKPLTEREAAVLELIAKGYGNRQIATTLNLAEGTAKNHVNRIMSANTRTGLAVLVRARANKPWDRPFRPVRGHRPPVRPSDRQATARASRDRAKAARQPAACLASIGRNATIARKAA